MQSPFNFALKLFVGNDDTEFEYDNIRHVLYKDFYDIVIIEYFLKQMFYNVNKMCTEIIIDIILGI